jgi:hypothetical protein
MCGPALGLMSAGMSLVSGVAGASASHAAAEADYEAKSAVWKQNVVNSEAAARNEQQQIITNNLEEQAKKVQKDKIYDIQGAQKSALALTSAASAGIGGHSVDAIMSDIEGKALLNQTFTDTNYMYVAANAQQKLTATDTTLMSRINSVERPVEPADNTGLALLGGAAKFAGSAGSLNL